MIDFVKMQGCGNDFVVLDNRTNTFSIEQLIDLAPTLCHRKFGIGADGLMAIHPPKIEGTSYEMIYRNADGSDAGMCGNGGRCIARFAESLGLSAKHSFSVHNKVYNAKVNAAENRVQLNWADLKTKPLKRIWNNELSLIQVYTGTEHEVLITNEQHSSDWQRKVGLKIREDLQLNPSGCNVNFMTYSNTATLDVVTYERGVEDLTLACGTGALASAIAWHSEHREVLNSSYETKISMPGGDLICGFQFDAETGAYSQLSLTGEAVIVFRGSYDI